MKSEILVLRARTPSPPKDQGIPLGVSKVRSQANLQVQRAQEDVRELHAIREEDDVLAAAEVVPLKLHEPARPRSHVDAGELWGLTAVGMEQTLRTGDGATVAVLDTGIDRQHASFEHLDQDRLIEKDFSGDGNGDQDGHGTHCAGTVFGGMVGETQIGIAPGVSAALVAKVFGSQGGSSAALADAIEWAIKSGANIVSMSCGFDYPGMVERLTSGHDLPQQIAVARALQAYVDTREFFAAIARRTEFEPVEVDQDGRRTRGQAVVFVAAAGNSSDWDTNPDYVVGTEPPATSEGFLSVGALGRRRTDTYYVAGFSNGGPRVAAPGVDIVSASHGTADGLALMSGTSMATPHVAGVAALWYEEIKNRRGIVESGGQLKDAVIASARDHRIEPIRIRDAGRGIVQAPPMA